MGRRFQPVCSDVELFIWLYFHSDSWFSVGSALGSFSNYCDKIYITKFAIFTLFPFLSAHTTQWHELHLRCCAIITTVYPRHFQQPKQKLNPLRIIAMDSFKIICG